MIAATCVTVPNLVVLGLHAFVRAYPREKMCRSNPALQSHSRSLEPTRLAMDFLLVIHTLILVPFPR